MWYHPIRREKRWRNKRPSFMCLKYTTRWEYLPTVPFKSFLKVEIRILFNANTYIGNFASGTTNNATESNDDIGEGSNVTNATIYYSSTTGDNYHIKSSCADVIEDGADLDQDPYLPIIDDIDGHARDAATPDIGADEYASFLQRRGSVMTVN